MKEKKKSVKCEEKGGKYRGRNVEKKKKEDENNGERVQRKQDSDRGRKFRWKNLVSQKGGT